MRRPFARCPKVALPIQWNRSASNRFPPASLPPFWIRSRASPRPGPATSRLFFSASVRPPRSEAAFFCRALFPFQRFSFSTFVLHQPLQPALIRPRIPPQPAHHPLLPFFPSQPRLRRLPPKL